VATKVVEVIKVKLDDGTEIECKPLKIKYLREFMTTIADLQGVVDDNAKSLDVIIACSEIALKQYLNGEFTKEGLEDLLDLPTMYRIIEGASGIVLDDDSPNQ
jgi:hypothetical protein